MGKITQKEGNGSCHPNKEPNGTGRQGAMGKDAVKVLRSIPWEAAAFGRASGRSECTGTFLITGG